MSRPVYIFVFLFIITVFETNYVNCCCQDSCPYTPFSLIEKWLEEFKSSYRRLEELSYSFNTSTEQFYNYNEYFNETLALSEAEEFDFIIIGGGTSGLVIANRLSEVPEWKILLLEAGTKEEDYIQIPKYSKLLRTTPHSWNFKTVPQNHSCLGMVNDSCTIIMGKSLGGSSSINDMLYVRGNPRDYDLWADEDNLNWCWSSVLPYLKNIEDAHLEPYDKKYHHQGGYQNIEYPQHLTPLSDAVLGACKEAGFEVLDYNGKKQLGLGLSQMMTKKGKRNSVTQTYLKKAYPRKNLIVRDHSQVVKLAITTHTKDVKGVFYIHKNKLYAAKPKKEAILAAGPINTPKILLHSGIGPKDDIQHFYNDCIQDLHIGKNMKNRLVFEGLHYYLKDHHIDDKSDKEDDEILQYLKKQKGPYSTSGIEVLGFINTGLARTQTNYPDVELQFLLTKYTKQDEKAHNYKPEIYEKLFKPYENKTILSIRVILTHPKSCGSVSLLDKDPLHPPYINTNHLSDEDDEDLLTLLHGIKTVKKITNSNSFKALGLNMSTILIPGCENYNIDTDDYWKCAIKHLSYPSGDVIGTAKMGPENDKEAVVDKTLKVYNINRLRIADTSIIPVSITGNIMAASIMIGEKAAEFIKSDWE